MSSSADASLQVREWPIRLRRTVRGTRAHAAGQLIRSGRPVDVHGSMVCGCAGTGLRQAVRPVGQLETARRRAGRRGDGRAGLRRRPDLRRSVFRGLLPGERWIGRCSPGGWRRSRVGKRNAAPRPHPRPVTTDQRRHRALLRHPQVGAFVPGAHRRRRRARDGDGPFPRHLQPHPTAPVARRPDTARSLRRRCPMRRPAERPASATRDRAGLANALAAERSAANLRRRLCRWGFGYRCREGAKKQMSSQPWSSLWRGR